jgi:hypothetical protein
MAAESLLGQKNAGQKNSISSAKFEEASNCGAQPQTSNLKPQT